MLQRLHCILIDTKPQRLIKIQTLCVFEISHCLKRTLLMQIVCQHLFCVYQNPDGDLVLFLVSLYDFSLFVTWLLLLN